MAWPMSQDYNEAIQDAASCFADPELARAEAVTNALGLPMPYSGNFADVYAVQHGSRKWAVKCFTREIPGLAERYVEISSALQRARLPFMVEFKFLQQGIRVRGQWHPILKMEWVEGFGLNTFVKNNLDKPATLQTLCQIWVKLAVRLRETGMAHGDLQHGNVLLVPGAKAGALGIRLVDYDGMYVPSLELLKTVEVGHPCYQHPQRQREGLYNLHVDQFSHLVIYTALRGLMVGGRTLWDKFDNGDNLLFKQPDLVAPTKSPLFLELLRSSDPEVRKLAGTLAEAAQKPLAQTPLLEKLVPAPSTQVQAAPAVPKLTGVTKAGPSAANAFANVGDGDSPRVRARKRKAAAGGVLALVGVLGLLAAGGAVGAFFLLNQPKPTDAAVARLDTPTLPAPPSSSKATVPETPRTPPSSSRTGPPPSSKTETPVTPPKEENPPPPANAFAVTSVADVTVAPGEEARLEVLCVRNGPLDGVKVAVKGLPPGWAPSPAVVEGNKVTVRIPIPADTAEFEPKRLQLALSLGDENARGECNFTVKKKAGDPAPVAGLKELRRYEGVEGKVNRVALSPDGKTVVAAGDDGKVRFWNIEAAQLVRAIDQQKSFIQQLAFSPDGRQLLVASSGDNTLRLRDAVSGNVIREYDYRFNANGGTFSPDSQLVCLTGGTGKLTLNLATTGAPQRQLSGHKGAATAAAFTPDGKNILSGSTDRTARLWDAITGAELRVFEHPRGVFSVAVSPDGRLGLSGSEDGVVRILELASGQTLRTLAGHAEGNIRGVGFSRDGSRAVSAGADGTFRVWEVATGKELLVSPNHGKPVSGAVFTPAGDRVVACSHDGTVRLWDLGLAPVGPAPEVVKLAPPAPKPDPEGIVQVDPRLTIPTWAAHPPHPVLSPDGRTLLVAEEGGVLHRYDTATGKALGEPISVYPGKPIWRMAHSPDSKWAATVFNREPLKVWNVETGKEAGSIPSTVTQGVEALAVASKGGVVAISNKELSLITVSTSRLQVLEGNGPTSQFAFSSDGKLLAAATGIKATFNVWDVATGKRLKQLRTSDDAGISHIQFSPDGTVLAVSLHQEVIQTWEVKGWKELRVIRKAKTAFSSFAFSPDGKQLVSVGLSDPVARVWDVSTGAEMGDLLGYSGGGTNEVVWSRDGKMIVGASTKSPLCIWELPEKLTSGTGGAAKKPAE